VHRSPLPLRAVLHCSSKRSNLLRCRLLPRLPLLLPQQILLAAVTLAAGRKSVDVLCASGAVCRGVGGRRPPMGVPVAAAAAAVVPHTAMNAMNTMHAMNASRVFMAMRAAAGGWCSASRAGQLLVQCLSQPLTAAAPVCPTLRRHRMPTAAAAAPAALLILLLLLVCVEARPLHPIKAIERKPHTLHTAAG
jgi:hypothetical protein